MASVSVNIAQSETIKIHPLDCTVADWAFALWLGDTVVYVNRAEAEELVKKFTAALKES